MKSYAHRGFQVRQHRPWKLWIGFCVLLALIATFFYLGSVYQRDELEFVKAERAKLISQVADLKVRNQKLLQSNAHLQGGSKIDSDAYGIANQELIKLQRELLAQKEELVFYRGIVSPKNAALSVNLQSFEMRKKNNQNQYSYKMILTKSGKSVSKIRGDTSVLIRGEQAGGLVELVLSDLSLEKSGKQTRFAFRYFQIFEADFALPSGFEPFEVQIGIKSASKKVKSFTETIAWASVLSEGI